MRLCLEVDEGLKRPWLIMIEPQDMIGILQGCQKGKGKEPKSIMERPNLYFRATILKRGFGRIVKQLELYCDPSTC